MCSTICTPAGLNKPQDERGLGVVLQRPMVEFVTDLRLDREAKEQTPKASASPNSAWRLESLRI
jgi:hypothetical protein